ncbi:MAG: hypothetical protein ACYDAI_03305 [Trichloromonadaceae bacterium]
MKTTQMREKRGLEHFERALSERLDTMERRAGTGNSGFHTGTERLLIHLAFERIRKNEYRCCVKCTGEIAEGRLRADPTTLTCAECEPNL